MDYIAIIHKDEDSDFGVSFPDFPGCITAGHTVDEAKDEAKAVLELHIAGMLEDGEKIPSPSNLETVMKEANNRNGVAFLVSATAPDKTVRINITVRERDLSMIDQNARAAHMSRSEYLVSKGVDS